MQFQLTTPAKTIFPFGIYVLLLGLVFLLVPEFFLALAGVETSPDIVSRIFGTILIFLGYYYINTALIGERMNAFFRLTVHTRASVTIFLVAFTLAGLANPIVILFGLIDFLGAVWTWNSLRNNQSITQKQPTDVQTA